MNIWSLLFVSLLMVSCIGTFESLIEKQFPEVTSPEPETPTPLFPPMDPIVFPYDPSRYYDERELILRTMTNFEEEWNVERVLDMAEQYEFTTISLTVKQDEDDPEETESGHVFFQSDYAPRPARYQNWDVLGDVITGAKARGLKVKAWFPVFHDQIAAIAHPDWVMKALVGGNVVPYIGSDPDWPEHFLNPLHPDVQDYQIALIKEFLHLYEVDFLVLDWIRFDDYNMDMSDTTRAEFQSLHGIDPITIDFSTSNSQRTLWNEYRTTKLADFVQRVRTAVHSVRPGLEVGAYILPPEFEECAQDVTKLAPHLDFFSPMAYYDDWGYPVSWVYDNVIAQVHAKAPGKKIIPTFDFDWSGSIYQQINTQLESLFPTVRSAAFLKYYWWDEEDAEAVNDSMKK